MGHFPIQAQVGLKKKDNTIRNHLKCHLQRACSSGLHAGDTHPLVMCPVMKWSCPAAALRLAGLRNGSEAVPRDTMD